jgi:V/A-type H+-transporting ATPase subunit B
MNTLVRLYSDAKEAKTKLENGFDLNDYDLRCMDFSKEYSRRLLAIDVNITIDEMLNIGWELMSTYFEKYELGIKNEFVEEYWKEGLVQKTKIMTETE